MDPKKNWNMSAKANCAAIDISGTIGADAWEDGVTAKAFIDDLKALGAVDEIRLSIYSGGGSVIEGNAIFTALATHPAKVIAHVDFAASMATIIASAADEIHMAENAFFMIHNPWSIAIGDSTELKATAELLDKMKANAISAYQRHSNLSSEEISGMMDSETWMTAAEAQEHGFVQEVTPAIKIAASVECARELNPPEAAKVFLSIDAPAEPAEPEAPAEEPAEPEASTEEDAPAEEPEAPAEPDAEAVEAQARLRAEIKAEMKADLLLTFQAQQKEDANKIAKLETLTAKLQSEKDKAGANYDRAHALTQQLSAKLDKLTSGGMNFHQGESTWAEALAKHDGNYVEARKAHPDLYNAYMKQAR